MNTSMIRRREKDPSIGQTADSMWEDGKMVSSMGSETTRALVARLNKENGRRVKDFIGSKVTNEVLRI